MKIYTNFKNIKYHVNVDALNFMFVYNLIIVSI